MPLSHNEAATLRKIVDSFVASIPTNGVVLDQERLAAAKEALHRGFAQVAEATQCDVEALAPKTYLDGINKGIEVIQGWENSCISTLDIRLLQAVASDFLGEKARVESLVS